VILGKLSIWDIFIHPVKACICITQLKACRNKKNQGWVTGNTMQGQDQRLKLRNAYNIITKILKTNTVCLCSLNSSPASTVHIESFSCILIVNFEKLLGLSTCNRHILGFYSNFNIFQTTNFLQRVHGLI
jgi:hypothetical protein